MEQTTVTIRTLTPKGVKVSGQLLEGEAGLHLARALVECLNQGGGTVEYLPTLNATFVEKRARRKVRRTRKAAA